jgi:hypothetical protein
MVKSRSSADRVHAPGASVTMSWTNPEITGEWEITRFTDNGSCHKKKGSEAEKDKDFTARGLGKCRSEDEQAHSTDLVFYSQMTCTASNV